MKETLFEKTHHLRVTDKSLRALSVGAYSVTVDACGVCGTALHKFLNVRR